MLAAVMLSDLRGRMHMAWSRSSSVVLPQPRTGLVTISRGVTAKRWYTNVCDPWRHRDELVRGHFEVARQQMVHELKRIDGGIGRGMIVPIGPRL
jgi:hypothetical protein